ncbi:MAG: cyclic nucleotide-binding domain-containing protein [Ilumatobacteraceae bacterium]
MRTVNPALERVRRLAPFAKCPPAELDFISRRCLEHHAIAGAALVRQGQTGREFGVIVDGIAVVSIGQRVVARLGVGDFFGEIALLDREERTANVVAETDLVALVCSAREFDEIIEQCPVMARRLLTGLAGRIRAIYRDQGGTNDVPMT